VLGEFLGLGLQHLGVLGEVLNELFVEQFIAYSSVIPCVLYPCALRSLAFGLIQIIQLFIELLLKLLPWVFQRLIVEVRDQQRLDVEEALRADDLLLEVRGTALASDVVIAGDGHVGEEQYVQRRGRQHRVKQELEVLQQTWLVGHEPEHERTRVDPLLEAVLAQAGHSADAVVDQGKERPSEIRALREEVAPVVAELLSPPRQRHVDLH